MTLQQSQALGYVEWRLGLRIYNAPKNHTPGHSVCQQPGSSDIRFAKEKPADQIAPYGPTQPHHTRPRRMIRDSLRRAASNNYSPPSSEKLILLRPGQANTTTAPGTVYQAGYLDYWQQWELAMRAKLATMDRYIIWTVSHRESLLDIKNVGASILDRLI